MSCSIATTILEDTAFLESFLVASRYRLAEQYALATKRLDQAGTSYYPNGYAAIFFHLA
jgi:hypothetical protein